ncbi:hypothetical protein EMCRGX_G008100 [Ephydatia muelleri]
MTYLLQQTKLASSLPLLLWPLLGSQSFLQVNLARILILANSSQLFHGGCVLKPQGLPPAVCFVLKYHALSCRQDFCPKANLSVKVEAGSTLTPDLSRSRPADALEASVTPGTAALLTEWRKHQANDPKCHILGWKCTPLAVESYGSWGSEARQVFSHLASRLSFGLGIQKPKILVEMYGKLNIALVRKEKASDFFQPLQLGVACASGTEKIIHKLRRCVEDHWSDNDFAVIKIDMKNAFNLVFREALSECFADVDNQHLMHAVSTFNGLVSTQDTILIGSTVDSPIPQKALSFKIDTEQFRALLDSSSPANKAPTSSQHQTLAHHLGFQWCLV